MKIEPGKFCPLIKKDCLGTGCKWFRPVGHINNATKEHYDEWDCAIAWLVVLQKDAISAALTTILEAEIECKRTGLPDEAIARRLCLRLSQAARSAKARR